MSGSLASFEMRQGRSFRRWMLVSALGHAALLVAFGLSPRPPGRVTALPAVVKVNLIAAPARPASRPAPKPIPEPPKPAEPIPEPPPAPPPPKKVLPAEPTRIPEPPKPKARPEPPRREPAPKPKESYQDVLASLREEAGEEPAQPVAVADARPLPDAPATGGVGVPVSAEEAAWRRRAKLHVHRAWVLAPGFRRQALETEVRVKLGPGGHVLDLRVTHASGNPWYDESVERAIRKASPLPRPPEPGEWTFLFRPEDLFG